LGSSDQVDIGIDPLAPAIVHVSGNLSAFAF
jgi:hypothetical protein